MVQHDTADRDHCLVTVCRGCCCGDLNQYPGVDHDALVADLGRRVAELARMRLSDCLLRCDQANVVIVSPSPSGRVSGAAPVWLSRIFDHEQNTLIADWIAAGGPGRAALPADLTPHLTQPFVSPSPNVVATKRVGNQPSSADR